LHFRKWKKSGEVFRQKNDNAPITKKVVYCLQLRTFLSAFDFKKVEAEYRKEKTPSDRTLTASQISRSPADAC
jgi:hypothetical protein